MLYSLLDNAARLIAEFPTIIRLLFKFHITESFLPLLLIAACNDDCSSSFF